MDYHNFLKTIAGKTGMIYVARRGTVTVIELEDGTTYMLNNLCASAIVVNPVDLYWSRSVDWTGGFKDYFWTGMIPADNPRIKSAPLVPITAEQKNKLIAMAEAAQKKYAAMV